MRSSDFDKKVGVEVKELLIKAGKANRHRPEEAAKIMVDLYTKMDGLSKIDIFRVIVDYLKECNGQTAIRDILNDAVAGRLLYNHSGSDSMSAKHDKQDELAQFQSQNLELKVTDFANRLLKEINSIQGKEAEFLKDQVINNSVQNIETSIRKNERHLFDTLGREIEDKQRAVQAVVQDLFEGMRAFSEEALSKLKILGATEGELEEARKKFEATHPYMQLRHQFLESREDGISWEKNTEEFLLILMDQIKKEFTKFLFNQTYKSPETISKQFESVKKQMILLLKYQNQSDENSIKLLEKDLAEQCINAISHHCKTKIQEMDQLTEETKKTIDEALNEIKKYHNTYLERNVVSRVLEGLANFAGGRISEKPRKMIPEEEKPSVQIWEPIIKPTDDYSPRPTCSLQIQELRNISDDLFKKIEDSISLLLRESFSNLLGEQRGSKALQRLKAPSEIEENLQRLQDSLNDLIGSEAIEQPIVKLCDNALNEIGVFREILAQRNGYDSEKVSKALESIKKSVDQITDGYKPLSKSKQSESSAADQRRPPNTSIFSRSFFPSKRKQSEAQKEPYQPKPSKP